MTEKLEPPELMACPCCGGAAKLSDTNGFVFYMWCNHGCGLSTKSHRTAKEATAAWNRRATTLDPERIATHIVREVCELPDRNSPDDQPEMLLVTCDELHGIVVAAMENTNGD